MNILKCMVGPGCFALPVSFQMAGLWVGLGMIFFVGFSSAYCMLMLVQAAQYLCRKSGRLELDYGHLAKKAFDYSTPGFQKFSKVPSFRYVTNTLIAAFQLGVCSVQIVFLVTHLKEVSFICKLRDRAKCTSFFRLHLKSLTPLIAVANAFMLLTFFAIFQKIILPPNHIASLPGYTNFNGFLLAAGSMLYAFEGQAVILPLENKMKHPEDLLGWNGVLSVSMTIVTAVYAATGFFGYATFGDEVKGSITLNMPQTWVYDSVKVMLMIAVFLGYPVQLYVVTAMLWPGIKRKVNVSNERNLLLLELAVRAVLVCTTYVFAIAIPNLEKIIPFVGVTAGMFLGFVFPPSISIIAYAEDVYRMSRPLKYWFFTKNIFFICLGIVGTMAGLYANLLNIFN
ncbi:Transmembrane amino acid transporter protein [Trichuris trichiura]|uniref:Transmembrane amino acid transporter protein n=1 Tax=Trichuris trichiura TaxID=36087 RepID=A0A077Z4V2_TRITR|nr:Transmembrane amino acid transporter protein [Trichuris trichiura]